MLTFALGIRGWKTVDSTSVIDLNDDLPCPWCLAPTSESDSACPSCGRSFGMTGTTATADSN